MARSLGLTAYRALMRRGEAPAAKPRPPRPGGELVWLHAAEADSLTAVLDLAGRLAGSREGLTVLITRPDDPREGQVSPDAPPAVIFDTLPSEHPDSVAAFLDHWKPDTCLWTWGGLRPNLVLETHARGCPMILLDADSAGFDGRRDRWMPDLTGKLLSKFSHVLARSQPAQRRLVQAGLSRDSVRLTSPLLAGGRALPCADSDLADLGQALGGRPTWFAAGVQEPELPIVLQAHRQALRQSHRLLLILTSAQRGQVEDAALQAAELGLDTIVWGEGPSPDESTQVMIADDLADRGLFFRLAPVSFLGSSLTAQGGGCDPFEAAALGSAVLYGPRIGRYLSSYSRLAAAGAARIVNDADALGTAVARLIAPEHAATMAHAGWDVISQGAELTDQITDLVQDALDARVRQR